MADPFCAICEQPLTAKDSDHVCRSCFRKAREPKKTVISMTDEQAGQVGFALAVGNFLSWGIERFCDYISTLPKQDDKTFDCPLV